MSINNRIYSFTLFLFMFLFSFCSLADGNINIESFSKTKKLLLTQVYSDIPKKTIYCDADFNSKKKIINPNGFYSTKYRKRALRVEWEHIVPTENFGRVFKEWREGHPDCINGRGEHFKGRNCASKVNREFRLMQSDMHNLFPAIGAVNALRSNYNMTMLNKPSKQLGDCLIQVDSELKRVEPPDHAKGVVARTYLYMESTYSRYKMSKHQRKLMNAWDKMYPVTRMECFRLKEIEGLQNNENPILLRRCRLN